MGYRLYRAGKLTNAKAHGKGREHRLVGAFCGVPVYADTIEDYVNDEFYFAFQYWQYTKMWGMANGNIGWGNEPLEYIDAITALETEQNTIEHEEMDKVSSKNKIADTKGVKEGRLSNTVS